MTLVNPATEGISMAVLEETVVDRDELRIEALLDQLLEECPPASTPEVEFLGRQFDLGLAWVHFPEGTAASACHRS